MTTYVVTYDLSKPGQQYNDLIEALKGYGTYFHIQQSVWIIHSSTTAGQVRDHLQQYIDSNDKLFVATLSGEAAWIGYDVDDTKWLKDNL